MVEFDNYDIWMGARKIRLCRRLGTCPSDFVGGRHDRASEKSDQITQNLYFRFSIFGLRLEYAVNANDDIAPDVTMLKHPVEVCTCPEKFKGLSCETCEIGWYFSPLIKKVNKKKESSGNNLKY